MNIENRVRKKDEGYTNIRIRTETREELRAIGTYSENMDDIVRKCLVAYKTITNSGGKVVNKIVVEEPVDKPVQPQEQFKQTQESSRWNQQPDLFSEDKPLIPSEDEYHLIFRISTPGLKFPISKKDLMEFSQNNIQSEDFGIISKAIQKMHLKTYELNEKYKNKEELEEELMNIYNDDMRESGMSKRITKCIMITDEKSRKSAEEFLEEQRVKRKTLEAQE